VAKRITAATLIIVYVYIYIYVWRYTQKVHKMFPKSRNQGIILAMLLTPGLLLIGDGEKILAA